MLDLLDHPQKHLPLYALTSFGSNFEGMLNVRMCKLSNTQGYSRINRSTSQSALFLTLCVSLCLFSPSSPQL